MHPCTKCGNVNSTDSIFCGTCGNRLNNKCPLCAFDNLPQQQFCGNCGKQLQADSDLPGSAVRYGQPASGGTAAVAEPAAPPVSPSRQQESQRLEPSVGVTTMPDSMAPPTGLGAPVQAAPVSVVVASLEIANWEQLKAEAPEAAQLEAERNRLLSGIAQQVMMAGGQVKNGGNGIMLIAFAAESTLRPSIERAVETCLDLLEQEARIGSQAARLKIGMDIQDPRMKQQHASTLERSIGLSGTLTVSETVYREIQGAYPAEMIGPVPMGDRTMHFYRLTLAEPLPELAQYMPASQISIEPSPGIGEIPMSPSADPGQGMHSGIQTQAAPPTPGPLERSAMDVARAADEQDFLRRANRTLDEMDAPGDDFMAQEMQEGMPPSPVHYEPPTLGLCKTSRPANLNYEQAIEALTTELTGFLSEGPGARGRILALCATDGLGKSNIINMARAQVDPQSQRAIWIGGHNYRCFQRNELPLYYWLEMMQNLLSLVFEGQPAKDVTDQIRHFLAYVHEGDVPPEDIAFLSDLLSVHPPQPLSVESREQLGRIETYFSDFYQELSAKRPVILVIEDLSFADTASLEVLTRLLEKNLLDRPVCLIFTQPRDFYAAGRLAACLQKVSYKELVISDLEDTEAERFLNDGPLGGRLHEFPAPLVDTLLRYAGGVPIYLEEALRWLHLKEVVTVDPNTHKFVMNGDFDASHITLPRDLVRLVRMRLEFLNDQTLYVLRLASVLGEKFAVSMLMALSQLSEADFNQALTTLFNHGYLLPDAVNTGRFRHGLIWQAVYEDIDDELRVQMHQLVSEALENDFNRRLTVNPMLIAHHAENGRLPNRALNYWNLAGIFAAQVGSLVGMNMALFRAIDILRESTKAPLHTQELAVRMMENLGIFNLKQNPDLAIDALEWVFYYRKLEGDFASIVEPLGFLASAYETKGDYVKALSTIEKALQLIDRDAYPLETASLLISKLEHLYTLGRMQSALELMERSIEPIAAGLEQDGGQGKIDPDFMDAYLQARLIKAQVLLAQCNPQVMPLLDETLSRARHRGLEGLVVALQLLRGQALLRAGDYNACNQEADGLLSAIEAMEDSDWFLAQWGLLAMMYHCALEDWESASQLVLTVMSKSEETRDYLTWITAQVYAGRIAGKMGKTQEALKLLEQAVELSSEHHFATPALTGWRALAELEHDRGAYEVAYEIASKALEIAGKPEILNTYEAHELTLTSIRALMAQGNLKVAGKWLETLWQQVAITRLQPLIAACAFEIGMLYKRFGDGASGDQARKYLMRSVEFFLKAKGIWLEQRHLPNVKRVDSAIPQI